MFCYLLVLFSKYDYIEVPILTKPKPATMKSLFSVVFFFSMCLIVAAQEFELPKNISLRKAKDYLKYNTAVVNAVNWLEKTPIQEQIAKREKVSEFLTEWVTGTETLTINIYDFQVVLTDKNPDLLMTFLGAYSKFVIENPSEKDNELASNIAAFKSLLKVYKNNKGKGILIDEKVEKLLSLDEAKLKKWIKKQLAAT